MMKLPLSTKAHAEILVKGIDEGGLTGREAFDMLSAYNKAVLGWQLTILAVVIAAAGVALMVLPEKKERFSTSSACVLAKVKDGMNTQAVIAISNACDDLYPRY